MRSVATRGVEVRAGDSRPVRTRPQAPQGSRRQHETFCLLWPLAFGLHGLAGSESQSEAFAQILNYCPRVPVWDAYITGLNVNYGLETRGHPGR